MARWKNKDNQNEKSTIKLSRLSNLGLTFSDEVLKNIKSTTPTQFQVLGNSNSNINRDLLYSLQLNDVTSNLQQSIPIFQENYARRRDFLRKFAVNNEISNILSIVCDSAIIYNEDNYFCRTKFVESDLSLQTDVLENIKNDINIQFKRIYSNWGFKNSNLMWRYCKKFLIDGFLAFEIVWDKNQKNIIGFVELDAAEVQPVIKEVDGEFRKFWVVYPNHQELKRELSDSQVIFTSWQKINDFSRFSYIENLVRSYNILKLMEDTRAIWNITNATFRLKMVFPQGELESFRQKEKLQTMLNAYKEDLQYNTDTGELSVNGRAGLLYYKNYVMSSKDGDQPDIEVLSGEGPELNDTDLILYFQNKLRDDSIIPRNRFLRDGTSSWQVSNDGIAMEEIQFANFINQQVQSNLKEIILKPLRLQLLSDFPFLKDNEDFIHSLSIIFETDQGTAEQREVALFEQRANLIETLGGINDTRGDNPIFSKEFLIRKFLKISDAEWKENKGFLAKELGTDYLGDIDTVVGDDDDDR